jgi:hypothetical protein
MGNVKHISKYQKSENIHFYQLLALTSKKIKDPYLLCNNPWKLFCSKNLKEYAQMMEKKVHNIKEKNIKV